MHVIKGNVIIENEFGFNTVNQDTFQNAEQKFSNQTEPEGLFNYHHKQSSYAQMNS